MTECCLSIYIFVYFSQINFILKESVKSCWWRELVNRRWWMLLLSLWISLMSAWFKKSRYDCIGIVWIYFQRHWRWGKEPRAADNVRISFYLSFAVCSVLNLYHSGRRTILSSRACSGVYCILLIITSIPVKKFMIPGSWSIFQKGKSIEIRFPVCFCYYGTKTV